MRTRRPPRKEKKREEAVSWRESNTAEYATQDSCKLGSDFGTVEDAGERRVDLGRILTPWPVATGGAIFRQVCYV
jgi:hypothetical protein